MILYIAIAEEPSRMRPDIVWFGEIPMEMDKIYQRTEGCDVFIVIGSSGHVYPAAGLVNLANYMVLILFW